MEQLPDDIQYYIYSFARAMENYEKVVNEIKTCIVHKHIPKYIENDLLYIEHSYIYHKNINHSKRSYYWYYNDKSKFCSDSKRSIFEIQENALENKIDVNGCYL